MPTNEAVGAEGGHVARCTPRGDGRRHLDLHDRVRREMASRMSTVLTQPLRSPRIGGIALGAQR